MQRKVTDDIYPRKLLFGQDSMWKKKGATLGGGGMEGTRALPGLPPLPSSLSPAADTPRPLLSSPPSSCRLQPSPSSDAENAKSLLSHPLHDGYGLVAKSGPKRCKKQSLVGGGASEERFPPYSEERRTHMGRISLTHSSFANGCVGKSAVWRHCCHLATLKGGLPIHRAGQIGKREPV